jgi:glutathione synthase/RimK-type ligase-like ATP-grasp enzyme
MKIGIVTCNEYPQLTEPEKPLIGLLASHGIEAEPLVWNDASIDWKKFDCLLLRSVWDYHLLVKEFFEWLSMLGEIQVLTLNSLPVVNWNRHKFYLQELENKGVKIVPTLFVDKTTNFSLAELKSKGWKQAVIKPAVSANSFLTESFSFTEIPSIEKKFHGLAAERDFLVQSFMPEVQSSGEVSLVFFDKQYSHAVVKLPAQGDFRVQEEHGGKTISFDPTPSVIDTATKILSWVEEDLLYARVDGVIRNGEFILMELELIEPELFFHFNKEAAGRFVEAVLKML